MDKDEINIKEKELALNRRNQNIGILKFFIGTLLIGVVSLLLDFDTLFHKKIDDNRKFLVNQIEMLRENNPIKRLDNIIMLKGINGAPSNYLNNLENEAIAEIEKNKAEKEAQIKIAKRKKAEADKVAKEKIELARREEKAAIAAKILAENKAKELRIATRMQRDKALQEAYPNRNLFDLKRQGYQLP